MQLKRQGKEPRTLRLYGQERNLITSAIARMNLFLHGFEDFRVERGDTLADPKLLEGDSLRRFDLVLANPPYSIKQWNRKAWETDRYGREDDHIEMIVRTYADFAELPGFSHAATLDKIRGHNANLSIPLYVQPAAAVRERTAAYMADPLKEVINEWQVSSEALRATMDELFATLVMVD